jgi:GH24 family phage-related lysozyme (muramidase)
VIDHEKAWQLIEPFEGTIPHMYLDTRGYVTVGVGNLLATPQTAIALAWQWREKGRGGEPDNVEVADEWTRVHGSLAGLTASAYRPITSMELPASEIRRLFGRRVDEFETTLQHHFPEFSIWPEPAQLATLDMAFNLGAGALPRDWPNLTAALRRKDWQAAAQHAHRPQSRPDRNATTQGLFVRAAQTAG